MGKYSAWDDDDDDRDWSTGEFDDDPVDEDADEEPTIPCPGCGGEIYAEADACPYCGEYLLYDDLARRQRPAWVWWGAILGLVAMLTTFVMMAWALLGP